MKSESFNVAKLCQLWDNGKKPKDGIGVVEIDKVYLMDKIENKGGGKYNLHLYPYDMKGVKSIKGKKGVTKKLNANVNVWLFE